MIIQDVGRGNQQLFLQVRASAIGHILSQILVSVQEEEDLPPLLLHMVGISEDEIKSVSE